MDKQSAGASLALLATALMLVGVFTNSWWKVQRGWSWAGVGLLQQKVCVDPPDMMERCRSIKHADFRKAMLEMARSWEAIRAKLQTMIDNPRSRGAANQAELHASLERLDEMLSNRESLDVTVGDGSWITMGKLLYYGTFLVLILLGAAVTLSRIEHDHAVLVAKLAALACFALLSVSAAFVFRVPDYLDQSVPAYSAAYSRWLYWLGAACGTAAGVTLSAALGTQTGAIDSDTSPAAAARSATSRQAHAGHPTCPQCGEHAIYREDIKSYICGACRISV